MDNFSAISDEFNGFGNSAVNQVNVVVVDVQTKSIEVVNIVTMYYQTVAKNIRSCTKAFADAAKSSKENKSSWEKMIQKINSTLNGSIKYFLF